MKLLYFDTCFNKTYIVYMKNEEITESKVIESTSDNYHSVYLIPEIKNILKNNNIMTQDLDAIGTNIGPGSFTGIRAGITIASVLASRFGIKTPGITSLEILSSLNITDKKTAVITDARKNRVYYAEYDKDKTLIEPCLKDKDDIKILNTEEYFIITDSSICNYLKQFGILSLNFESADRNLGIYGAKIAYKKLINNSGDFLPQNLKPLYIQPPSITKPKEVSNV